MRTYKERLDLAVEYYDSHINCTMHEVCAIFGVLKPDLKRALMGGQSMRIRDITLAVAMLAVWSWIIAETITGALS